MNEKIIAWLGDQGVAGGTATGLSWGIIVAGIAIIAIASNYVTRQVLLAIVHIVVKRSKTEWDDVLAARGFFRRLSHLAPALVIYGLSGLLGTVEGLIENLAVVYMLLVGAGVWGAFLSSVVDIYQSYEISKDKPIKGYVQVVRVISYVLIGIVAAASLLGKSPIVLLSGLGALSAVLILVFKDSILGLVAGIQLSGNDMVRRGDWIEMPKYGADGDVIDVSLNTVKVQNFDKTIVSIPSYALISDSFRNWRGMQESDGRRIKRAILIDVNSVKFCTDEMLDRFEKFAYISEYIHSRRKEVADYNQKLGVDPAVLLNGRRLTNVGTFRAYLAQYLRHHKAINQDMTFLVRQLPVSDRGLPLEIYVFSSIQAWAQYEDVQADIFDHLLAALPEFELRAFQNPSGHDFREAVTAGAAQRIPVVS